MLSRKAGGPVTVHVPDPAQDRPSWRRVGIIAAVGFIVGIAWPRLAGVRLGPSLPEVSSATAAFSTSAMQTPSAEVAPSVAPSPAAAGPAAGPTVVASSVSVSGLSLAASSPATPKIVTAGGNGHTTLASASASARSGGDTADGTALVVWEVALVRDAPKSGKVVARLQRGVAIRIGPVKDGWYPVRYGDGFASEGWVYRGAIGR